MESKIKLGISSCLLGNPVRYDGGHRLDPYLRNELGRQVEWVPMCPEVEAGFPVPREPMRLFAGSAGNRLITVETHQDKTLILTRLIAAKLLTLEEEGVRGFVFKARSPSCGVYDTPVNSPSGEIIEAGAGLFAAAVMQRFPLLPVEDEEGLHDRARIGKFFSRIPGGFTSMLQENACRNDLFVRSVRGTDPTYL